ncbi:ubiquitin-conjugating enzyme E2 K-like isoform X2 [Thrips palmi]|uniref:Ubiquitin-conjugating enzyme E2 K-like isoform X2 n=1 Tax=Thrips palmi TaxID=161013 RepID=A0A6P8YF20_THRPL|nr:ubiquitin-conjugating enzyme E2 K-like isoform X2 [Thrips palmi]
MDLTDFGCHCNHTERNGISVCLKDDNMNDFHAFLKGPADTPYAGGTFKLRVMVPPEYPVKPPAVTFVTKIWHPNISSHTGFICLDILASKWPGSMNLRGVLLSVQNLLANPEKEDPQDSIVGRQAVRDESIFIQTAQEWTKVYANGCLSDPALQHEIGKLVDMGYDRDLALRALSECDWDMDEAIEKLVM